MKDFPFKIASAEECEQAAIAVCMRAGTGDETRFDDNVYGVCADCGHAIYYRPYAPKTPPKVCVHCALDRGRYFGETIGKRLKGKL